MDYHFDDELKKIVFNQFSLVVDCRKERNELSCQKKLKNFYGKKYSGEFEEHFIEIGINGH